MKKDNKQEKKGEKKRAYGLLLVGAVLLIVGIVLTVFQYHSSYQRSLETAEELNTVKAQIAEIGDGLAEGDPEALQAEADALSARKLSQERPYSYSLILLFFAILLTGKGIVNAVFGVSESNRGDVRHLALAGLSAALCYIGFAFFKIDIPVGPEKTSFHFGNVFCVLAALLLDGYWGGLAGAIGMTIGDLTTSYVTSAPKTFLLKLCIGLITGFVAHKLFRLSREHSAKYVTGATVVSCICGMGFNVAADPIVGYFYKTYLLGVHQDVAAALAKVATVTTAVNAVVAVFAASALYLALRPALKKAGLFPEA